MARTQSSDSCPIEQPRRRRFMLGCAGLVLLILAGLGGLWVYLNRLAERELREVIAETDRQEPGGWRLQEIEAARKQMRDEDNAALVCMKIKQLMPAAWPALVQSEIPPDFPPIDDMPPMPPGGGPGADPAGASADPYELDRRLGDLPQAMQLDAELLRQLRINLDRVDPAREEARRLCFLSEGRYPVTWPPGSPMSALLSSQDGRPAARLLQIQAVVQAQQGKPDDALDSVRGILIVARSIGDEPTLVSMLIRIAVEAVAVNTLERVLAQGAPSPAALVAVQRLLEQEQREPVFLHGARGERAVQHEVMESMKRGTLSLTQAGGAPAASPLARLADLSSAALARRSHPRLLRMMNEFVETARKPSHEQAAALKALDDQGKQARSQGDILVALLVPAVAKCGEAARRSQGNLRTAIAAVALERYHRDHGRWPDRLDELVPRYLEALPEDPGVPRALRYQKVPGGVLVYWTGLDGKDDGGLVGPRATDPGSKDMGFRLWDPGQRRRPPRELLPEPRAADQDPPGLEVP